MEGQLLLYQPSLLLEHRVLVQWPRSGACGHLCPTGNQSRLHSALYLTSRSDIFDPLDNKSNISLQQTFPSTKSTSNAGTSVSAA
jgi:hypothetical protein